MSTLIGLLLVPIILTAGYWYLHRDLTVTKVATQIGLVGVLAFAFFIGRAGALTSNQHIHGRILSKYHGSSACCHCKDSCAQWEDQFSWEARTKQRNKSDWERTRKCLRKGNACQHARDHEWGFETTAGRMTPFACEASESAVPPEWTAAQVGEPATRDDGYDNYWLADPDAVLVPDVPSRYLDAVPAYPALQSYRVDSVVTDGAPLPAGWQRALRELNADLGPTRQVDVTVVLTNSPDPRYADAVRNKWLLGPKNSLNVVLGVDATQVRWARVVSFSRVLKLAEMLRDGLPGKALTEDIPAVIRAAVEKEFRRTPMAELADRGAIARPSLTVRLVLFGVALIASLSCLYYDSKFYRYFG